MNKIIMVPYANIEGFNSGVNFCSNDRVNMYLKDCCVALISAKQQNKDCELALVSNCDIFEPYLSLLKKNDILTINVPFSSFNFGSQFKWSLAFYKLCALKYAVNNLDYDYFCYLDSDVFVQDSFDNIFKECDENILLYDINHGLQVNNYVDFIKEIKGFLGKEILITQYGGEFFAAKKQMATEFVKKMEDIFNDMKEKSFNTSFGDEFILSLSAYYFKANIKNAGAYIFRYWTGDFRLISTNYKANNVSILHAPDEKNRGFIKIFNKYYKKFKPISKEKAWKVLRIKRKDFVSWAKYSIKRLIKR